MKNRRLRKILVFCLLGIIVAACSETGVEQATEHPIRFAASVNGVTVTPGTKAVVDGGDIFIANSIADLKDLPITLYGSEYLSGATTKLWEFMNAWEAIVRQSGSSYVFDYTFGYRQQQYFMPDDRARYDFRAIYPFIQPNGSNVAGVSHTATGFPQVIVDLKYCPDLMLASADGVSKNTVSPAPVALKFEHQLALVTFNIYKDIESPSTAIHKVFLNKVMLTGRTIAEFNLLDKEYSAFQAESAITLLEPGYPYSDFLVKDAPEKICDLFLFPADGNVAAEQYTFDFIINERSYKVVLPAGGKTWKKGLQYIYTIRVEGSDVYVELGDPDDDDMKLEQEEWDDEDMGEPIEGQ